MTTLERLTEVMKEVMPQVAPEKITMEADLINDLGIDSLSMLLVAITVEEEFGMKFEETNSLKKVKDIVSYVDQRKTK